MKRKDLATTAAACSLRLVVVCFVVAAASSASFAQASVGSVRAVAPAQPMAEEEFELNIDRRRISEKDFHAETAVETDGARGLQLGVGVALSASDIEVLLRNVRGHVRFRGSLAPVLRLLEARRAAPTQTPPP